jgi:hypothetical protein
VPLPLVQEVRHDARVNRPLRFVRNVVIVLFCLVDTLAFIAYAITDSVWALVAGLVIAGAGAVVLTRASPRRHDRTSRHRA